VRPSRFNFSGFLFVLGAVAVTCPLALARPYVKAVYSLPLTLDPIKMNDTASLLVGNLIYDGLLRFSPTLKLEGALAESWSTSNDGKTLTFVLRPDARFHDGEVIQAKDVVFSLRRAVSPESEVRKYFDCIEGKAGEGITAKDSRTVMIRLTHPFPPFLSVLAGATAKVLPSSLASTSTFFEHPVGSGAFAFGRKTSTPQKEVILSAFSDYYRGKPNIAEIALRELDEAAATKSAISGEIDDLANWPLSSENEVFQHGRNVSSPVAATWIIGLNVRKAPFRSEKMRRLFRHDVNAEAFRKKFYPDAAPAQGYVPPGLPGFALGALVELPMAKSPTKEKVTVAIPKELARSEEMRIFLELNLRERGWNAEVRTMGWADLMA
jgi:ABC-type transport system substrate-binding protein